MLSARIRRGFSLLELVVVIIILGVLATLGIPTFQRVINRSQASSVKAAAEALGRNAVAISSVNGTTTGVTAAEVVTALAETTTLEFGQYDTNTAAGAYTAANAFNSGATTTFIVVQDEDADNVADTGEKCAIVTLTGNTARNATVTASAVDAGGDYKTYTAPNTLAVDRDAAIPAQDTAAEILALACA